MKSLAQPIAHPPPNLSLDITNLTLDANNSGGTFVLKNTGGGILSGYILSRCRELSFSPASWEGNTQVITYSYSPSFIRGNIEAHVYICSNGGEIKLPLIIDASPMIIQTDEGVNIRNIADFYAYSQHHPAAARRLFASSEFYMLLATINYPYLAIYEVLHKDPNRERAMDNFFQISRLKGKTHLFLNTDRLEITQHPTEIGQVFFQVQKTDNGYADASISTSENTPWLSLMTTRITSYDHNHSAQVAVEINPSLIDHPFTVAWIHVGSEVLRLVVRKAPRFSLRLNQEGFKYQDRGTLEVENNTGFDMAVEIRSRDRHVRFYRASYTVPPGKLSIPFEIRQSAFFGTRRVFRRLPYISTYIDVRARCVAQEYKKRLHMNIGEW